LANNTRRGNVRKTGKTKHVSIPLIRPIYQAADFVEYLDRLAIKHFMESMLVPDQLREQRDDLLWCAPLLDNTHDAILKHAKGKGLMSAANGVECIFVGAPAGIAIVLPKSWESDDEALEAAAWMRMTLSFTGPIYIARKGKSGLEQVIGADPEKVIDIENILRPLSGDDADKAP
jgi:hypothetical protein